MLGNPGNRYHAVPLTYEQFRFSFANAVSEEEAHELYEKFVVPASGKPLFQAAAANLNPWSEAKVDTLNPERGPHTTFREYLRDPLHLGMWGGIRKERGSLLRETIRIVQEVL